MRMSCKIIGENVVNYTGLLVTQILEGTSTYWMVCKRDMFGRFLGDTAGYWTSYMRWS